MSMRSEVLGCLRERLLNESGSGRIFQDDQDHLDWLAGSADSGGPGFLSDPADALSRPICRRPDQSVHSGVELSGEEARQLRLAVSRAVGSGLGSLRCTRSGALIAAVSTFLGPIMAGGGGY